MPKPLDLEPLARALRGQVIRPRDPEYDGARALWNGMIDRRPAAIARCTGVADVLEALRFARDRDLRIAVRGGGHNVAGRAVCDDGLVLDLSRMRGIAVDPDARRVRVEPGATWGDLDHETQAFGLATTGGVDSRTGVAGLTLGGGIGFLARRHGLAIDNLVELEVVLADGSLVHVDEASQPDLFWALRGGGGAVGVVTSFTFDLHPLGPEVATLQAFHRLADAPAVLRAYRDQMADAPDELAVYAVFLRVPPIAPFPPEAHGTVALALVGCYAGAAADGLGVLGEVAAFGDPILAGVQCMPYTALQSSLDAGTPDGGRYYYKSEFLSGLPDAAIDTLVERLGDLPGAYTTVGIEPMGGAVARVPRKATAYPHRDAAFDLGIWGGWMDASEDAAAMAWVRDLHAAMATFGTGGVYANYLAEDDGDRAEAAYGANVERLRRVETRFDPDGVFRSSRPAA